MKRNDNPYDKMLNTAGRAAKAAASGLLLALLLAGCSQKNPVKTQPISSMESSSEALGETSQTAAASEISPSASGTAGSIETDAESYYRAKAEQDAIHIDIAKLEADFRVGKLSKEDFAAQKSQLEAEKDALDREEDRLEAWIWLTARAVPLSRQGVWKNCALWRLSWSKRNISWKPRRTLWSRATGLGTWRETTSSLSRSSSSEPKKPWIGRQICWRTPWKLWGLTIKTFLLCRQRPHFPGVLAHRLRNFRTAQKPCQFVCHLIL